VTVLPSTRLPTGFASLDQVPEWPRPRGVHRPERLQVSLDALPGVGPTVKRRLVRLGLEVLGDLLAHRPRRYVEAQRIADLLGEDDIGRGRTIAATGTVDVQGTVGEIGGVVQKAHAARERQSHMFVVPESESSVADLPGLDVEGVTTLDEALEALREAA
jgi:hypothetical protein